MGIDRHEVEHRNWRPAASKSTNEFDPEFVEQLDASIVPENGDVKLTGISSKRAERETIGQL